MQLTSRASAECSSLLTKIICVLVAVAEITAAEQWGVDPSLKSSFDRMKPHPDACKDEARMYPHPEDCTKFTRCVNNRLVTFSCPPLTAFDPETQICAWRVGKNGCGGKLGFKASELLKDMMNEAQRSRKRKEIVPYMANIRLKTPEKPRRDGDTSSLDAEPDLTIEEHNTEAEDAYNGNISEFNNTGVNGTQVLNGTHFATHTQVYDAENLTLSDIIEHGNVNVSVDYRGYQNEDVGNTSLLHMGKSSLDTTSIMSEHEMGDNSTTATLPLQDTALERNRLKLEAREGLIDSTDMFDGEFQNRNLSRTADLTDFTEGNSGFVNEFDNSTRYDTNNSSEPRGAKVALEDTWPNQSANTSSTNYSTTSYAAESQNLDLDSDVTDPTQNSSDGYVLSPSLNGNSDSHHFTPTTLMPNTAAQTSLPESYSSLSLDGPMATNSSSDPRETNTTTFGSISELEYSSDGYNSTLLSGVGSNNSVTDLLRANFSHVNHTKVSDSDINTTQVSDDAEKLNTPDLIDDNTLILEEEKLEELFEVLEKELSETGLNQSSESDSHNTTLTAASDLLNALLQEMEKITTDSPSSYSNGLDGFFSVIRPVPYFGTLGVRTEDVDHTGGEDSDLSDSHPLSSDSASVSPESPPRETTAADTETPSSTKQPDKQAWTSSQKSMSYSLNISDIGSAQDTLQELSNDLHNTSRTQEKDTDKQKQKAKSSNSTEPSFLAKPADLFIQLPLPQNTIANTNGTKDNVSETKVYVKDIPKDEPRSLTTGDFGRRDDLKSRSAEFLKGAQARPFTGYSTGKLSTRPLYVQLYGAKKQSGPPTDTREMAPDNSMPRRRWYGIIRPRRQSRYRGPAWPRTSLSRQARRRLNYRLRKQGRLYNKINAAKLKSKQQHAMPMTEGQNLRRPRNPVIKLPRDGHSEQDVSSPQPRTGFNESLETGSRTSQETRREDRAVPQIVSFKSAPYMVKGLKRPFQCPSNDGHFADPDDCAVFYHCDNGVAYRRDCPPGQVFHRAALACVSTKVAPPCLSGQHEEEHPSHWNQQQHPKLELQPQDSTARPVTSYPTVKLQCPGMDGLYRDPQSCSHYLDCTDGQAVRRECMGGTVFDASLGKCTWSKFVPGCEQPRLEALKALDTTGSQGVVDQDLSTRDLKSSVKNDSDTESVDTPFVCQRDGFFRDKGRCDIYYLCAGGDSLRLTCEPGTSFDPALNMCVWTKMVPGCNAKEDTVESSTDTDQGTDKEASDADGPKENRATPLLRSRLNPGFSCPKTTGLFPVSGDCEVYISCVDGFSTVMRCIPGTAFDRRTGRCVTRALVQGCFENKGDAWENPTENFVCPNLHGVYPDKDNCTAFVHCFQGVPYRHFCHPGTAYSPGSGSCTWKYLVPQCWRQAALSLNMKLDSPQRKHLKSGDFGISAANKWLKLSKYLERNFSQPLPESQVDGKPWMPSLDLSQRSPRQEPELFPEFSNNQVNGYFRFDNPGMPYHDTSYEGQRGNPNTLTWKEDSNAAHAQTVPEHISKSSKRAHHRGLGEAVPQRYSNRNIALSSSWDWSSPYGGSVSGHKDTAHDGVPLSPRRVDQYPMPPKSQLQGLDLPEFRCPSVKDGFYRDDVLCDVFHRCVVGERFTFVCPPGTFFRIDGNFCDHSAIMPDCNEDGIRITALSRFPHLTAFSSQTELNVPVPPQQTWSYRPTSYSDHRVISPISPHGQRQSYEGQPRVDKTIAQTSSPPPCPSPSGLFPHPDNCRQFLFCAHSVPLVLTCPNTLLYNTRTLTCDFPAKVVCSAGFVSRY